jgi:hypothetical protein
MLPEFLAEPVDRSFKDLVHDNWEMYGIAKVKPGEQPGAIAYYARCADRSGPEGRPWDWSGPQQRAVREQSKLPLEMFFYEGLRLLYEPIGGVTARTLGREGTVEQPKGWWLTKGEPLVVAVGGLVRLSEGLIKVICPALQNATAWVREEKVTVELGSRYGNVLLVGMPMRYEDILTVYSDQGSQHDNVCMHVGRFKPSRNNFYTGAMRAKKKLAIRGVKAAKDVRQMCELHPQSVLLEHQLMGTFSEERVQQARRDAEQQLVAAAGPS